MKLEIRHLFDSTIEKRYRSFSSASEDTETLNSQDQDRRRKKLQHILDSDPEFYVLHRCTNIAATWLSLLAVALLQDLPLAEEEIEPTAEKLAAISFLSRLANDLWAIIELIEAGFDLQARALTRAYLEHVDVLICCIHDEQLTAQFVAAVEPDEANEFWHRHVSKNKIKRRVSEFVSSVIQAPGSQVVDFLREDAELAGSMLLHPTITAGFAAAFGIEEIEYDSYPIFPTPTASSAGTFRAILIHLFWLWFAMGPLPTNANGRWRPLLTNPELTNNITLVRFSILISEMLGFLLESHLLMRPSSTDD
ncbi:hypothetical protein CYG48_00695 [Neorhizobium sp. SOG26]|uniref:hypothetical protein n=1 Tax=Neorhizobium sp. SOG26 TaxID=2060726 RepID=UPI000E5968FF|nr:hypothetical protein [Neorhizobium sp. SOG26]AXV14363.1 hypothetical protein CYG48_00695 [Neorhizobium sp. SOG26]